ncbi:hypothetical protein TVAG_459780 [Trichomonas vaginalis G3]|uniref:DUF6602 domain-containing protein n=1 Tax=Trichomonas vaginalis (strain ATCC PRA-98 / G3) TaxID=412133 RepID=A2G2G3_TRIV3|nr:SLL0572 protein family [Trichomonas vaginalis G3]EAX88663.1 hypothetical protein TVAG_459780 [Trichomonas vaginalis G3]KAI5485797.1 SLL0572 protein family [Trichomonas vaginalis G3]|eukprot:XP_001301593.1 hypothetical protein [Trichomonas vaginalis G3]
MATQTPRTRTLILGCDYTTFHLYWRYYSQNPEREIVGFVHCFPNPPPIKGFKGIFRSPIPVYSLRSLERIIHKRQVQRCAIQTTNISMQDLQSIINRILATGICGFEFLPKKLLTVRTFKRTIVISSLAPKVGKSQLARYFCSILAREGKRVAVIYPLTTIISQDDVLNIDDCPHFEFDESSKIPENIFSVDDEYQIKQYQNSGAYKIFATSDTRQAIICAEQCADIIILDAYQCDIPYIESEFQFCVVSSESLLRPRVLSLWPGLVNVHEASKKVVLTRGQTHLPKSRIDEIDALFKEAKVFYASSQYDFDGVATSTIFGQKVMTIDYSEDIGISNQLAVTYGASEIVTPSQSNAGEGVTVKGRTTTVSIPRAVSPLPIPQLPSQTDLAVNSSMESFSFEGGDSSELLNYATGSLPSHIVPVSSLEISDPKSDINDVLNEEESENEPEQNRTESPTNSNVLDERNAALNNLSRIINETKDVDVIISSINTPIPGLDPTKLVIYATPEINDSDGKLYKWIVDFANPKSPPLQKHFEAQVDILMSLASASDKELRVQNNDSSNRESFCRLFLSSHLPPGFRVTTGEIIDSNSNLTGQLDVVVVNDLCPSLTIDTSQSVIAPIPADSVLAVIEVKTTLTNDALNKALNQMRPIKALMPSHTTLLTPDGGIIDDPLGGKVIAGIFSFNITDEIEDQVPELLEKYPNVVDFIVLPDAFAFINEKTLKVCGMEVGSHELIHGYCKFTAKGMGLAMIYGILNSIAAIRRFNGMNCVRYISGSWGNEKDKMSKIIGQVSTTINLLDKYFTTATTERKNEYFRKKEEFNKIVADSLANYNKRTPRIFHPQPSTLPH